MRMNLRRSGAIGLATAFVAALAIAGAGSASADTIGTLAGIPASASIDDPFGIVSSAPCPEGTDGLSAYINNADAGWNDVVLVGFNDSEIPNINTTGVQAQDTLGSIASGSGLTLSDGTYSVHLDCRSGFVDVLGSFTGSFTITGTDYAFNVVPPTLGTVTGIPASASVDDPFGIVSSALCPEGTDGLSAYINNADAGWNDVVLVGFNDSELPNINTTGVQARDTLGSIAAGSGLTLPDGTYSVRLDCRSGFVDVLGSFTGSFTITGTNYAFDSTTPAEG